MISFKIPGRPVPKGRPRTAKGVIYTPARTREYEQQVKQVADYLGDKSLYDEDLAVKIKLIFKDRKHGDLDNYIKSITDALNGVLYRDDRQIKEIMAYIKTGQDEGAVILIDKLEGGGE